MKILSKYQAITLLAAVFGVFNVGAPIVIASCPMADCGLVPMCMSCPDESGSFEERLTDPKDTHCCATVIAADRNTNEFIQSKDVLIHVERMNFIHVPPLIVETFDGGNLLIAGNFFFSSLPRPKDIPIFNSSLLI